MTSNNKKVNTKDKKNVHVNSFLHSLKILIKEASKFIPDDPKIYRVNKRVMLAIQLDPGLTFQMVGEILYKYKDFIYDESTENLLLQWDFVESHNQEDKEVEDVSMMVISELKRCLSNMNPEQKKYYRKMVSSLLDDYIEYTCPP